VRLLVRLPGHNLQVTVTILLIANNKAAICQRIEESVHITVIVGQHLGLYAPRPIFQPSLTICNRPQPGKQ